MLFTEWKYNEDKYYESKVSLHQNSPTLFLITITPNNITNVYELVMEDFNTGIRVAPKKYLTSFKDAKIKAFHLIQSVIGDLNKNKVI